jgi:hypothetical protein
MPLWGYHELVVANCDGACTSGGESKKQYRLNIGKLAGTKRLESTKGVMARIGEEAEEKPNQRKETYL